MFKPGSYFNLSEESLDKVELSANEVLELIIKKDLSYREASAALDIVQEQIKDRKLT